MAARLLKSRVPVSSSCRWSSEAVAELLSTAPDAMQAQKGLRFRKSRQIYAIRGFDPLCCGKSHQATSVEDSVMLRYAIIFLIVAIIAAVLGFSGIAGATGSIAYILAVVFVILFILSLIFGRRARL
jgi:uncharacterized membrane protein YtjA (UPF0391 family)